VPKAYIDKQGTVSKTGILCCQGPCPQGDNFIPEKQISESDNQNKLHKYILFKMG